MIYLTIAVLPKVISATFLEVRQRPAIQSSLTHLSGYISYFVQEIVNVPWLVSMETFGYIGPVSVIVAGHFGKFWATSVPAI